MHLRKPIVFRLAFGLAAVLALALVVVSIGFNSDTPEASAIGPTPDKIGNDGPLGGLLDILVNTDADPDVGLGLFYCIAKNDHQVVGTVDDTQPDLIKVSLQCNSTTPGFGNTGESPPNWCAQTGACNIIECPGSPAITLCGNLSAGPPSPPPYGSGAPQKGYGFYYHDGNDPGIPNVAGGTSLCAGQSCTVLASCFEDLGAPTGSGPNLIAVAITFTDATTAPTVSHGVTYNYANENNATCKSVQDGSPDLKGDEALPLFLHTWLIADKGENPTGLESPWRNADNGNAGEVNFDGDECTDQQELDKTQASKCGDDPQNPSDSFAAGADLSGAYDIVVRARPGEGIKGLEFERADCGNPCSDAAQWVTGSYFYCRTDLQHDTGTNVIDLKAYCYTDSPSIDVNVQAYPGAKGDGFAGAQPPGPSVSPDNYAFGDVDIKQSALSGIYNPVTNNFEISGCFVDHDGFGGIGNAYITATVPAHQLAQEQGTVLIWANQDQTDCENGNPQDTVPTVTHMPWAFDIAVWQPHPQKGKGYDHDDDGIPTALELADTSTCGLRDPFNPYDYYDVSVPRDGVIDLSNDILGVILQYTPGGYSGVGGVVGNTTKINFDRPGVMTGSAGHWNRGSPDHVIDLSNDILGVILQYNPGGLPSC